MPVSKQRKKKSSLYLFLVATLSESINLKLLLWKPPPPPPALWRQAPTLQPSDGSTRWALSPHSNVWSEWCFCTGGYKHRAIIQNLWRVSSSVSNTKRWVWRGTFKYGKLTKGNQEKEETEEWHPLGQQGVWLTWRMHFSVWCPGEKEPIWGWHHHR